MGDLDPGAALLLLQALANARGGGGSSGASGRDKYLAGIARFLDRKNMRYRFTESGRIRLDLADSETNLEIQWITKASSHFFMIVCVIDKFRCLTSERAIGGVLEYITRLNYGHTVGNFDLSDDGQVLYRIGIDCEGVTSWEKLIEPMWKLATTTALRYAPGFFSLKQNPSQSVRDLIKKLTGSGTDILADLLKMLVQASAESKGDHQDSPDVQNKRDIGSRYAPSPSSGSPSSTGSGLGARPSQSPPQQQPRPSYTSPSNPPQRDTPSPYRRSDPVPGPSTPSVGSHADLPQVIIPYGDLEMGKKIGKGGFAAVYEAKWLGIKVAVKQIKGDLPKDVKEGVRNEAAMMKALTHPNIVPMLGLTDDPTCIVMQFMPKGTLHHVLQREFDTLTWPTKLGFLLDASRGLAYLHRMKVTHGDVKPLNMLIDEHNQLRISDFGQSTIRLATAATTFKVSAFTPAYAAPEVLNESRSIPESDIFAFGIVMWEVATGKTPWFPDNPKALIPRGDRPYRPSGVSGAYISLMEASWAHDPAQRRAFIRVIDELEKIQQSRFWV